MGWQLKVGTYFLLKLIPAVFAGIYYIVLFNEQ